MNLPSPSAQAATAGTQSPGPVGSIFSGHRYKRAGEEAGIGPGAPGNAATAPGVSERSIKIGVLFIQFPGEPPCGIGDYVCTVQRFADAINQAGGINGRNLHIVPEPYSPISAGEQVRACTDATEEQHVFAVIGDGFFSQSPCFTRDHKTPYLTSGGESSQQLQAAPGLDFSVAASGQRLLRNFVDVIENGIGGAPKISGPGHVIGTVEWNLAPVQEQLEEGLITPLRQYGQAPVVRSRPSALGGQLLTLQEDQEVAKQCAKGVTDIILADNPPVAIGFVQEARTHGSCPGNSSWHPRYWTSDFLGAAEDFFGTQATENFNGVVGITSARTGEARVGLPEPAADRICRETDAQLTGKSLERTTTDYASMEGACGMLADFAAAATAAGARLTPETLSSGYTGLGAHTFPFSSDISYRPDKYDGGDYEKLESWHYGPNQVPGLNGYYTPLGPPYKYFAYRI